jgi:hypothetical protein
MAYENVLILMYLFKCHEELKDMDDMATLLHIHIFSHAIVLCSQFLKGMHVKCVAV